MRNLTSSRPHRCLLGVALTAALAVGAIAPAGADPVDDARRERDAAQAAAVAAAQRYVDALDTQARQEAEIARLEVEIPALRARSIELQRQVQERAVMLYRQGSRMPLSRLVEAGSVVDAARAIHLTTGAAIHDRDLATELTHTATKLEHDQAQLRTLKAAQDQLVARLTDERALLDLALADADAALHNVEAVAASQAEFAGLDAAAAGRVQTRAAVCPIAGAVAFVNDWGAPRSGGRTHKGTDLFARYGTPNVAVTSGAVRWSLDTLGGLGAWLDGDDGVSYYYAHLSRVEGDPRRVARGEVIGYVGDTGNAAGGPPHTHFGIRTGGEMVNPYPTVRVLCRG